MYELKVVTRFAAAHRLTMVGTKCENMHGHNWKIEVFLTGEKLDEAGVVMDFGDIKTRLREIVGRLDHQYLNELAMFQGRQPSSERIATYIAAELQQVIQHPAVRVSRVSAWESEDACATYIVD
ncbi:MAG: 6-carboxytetrahydropterin synthase QueD [Desulfobacterales bacterium]|nr:6-carboxytetrahydropterin synthase QueD [Desulfobacterales bacterium]